MAKALARRYQPPPFVADGLNWPPVEHIDPYSFHPRSAEIIRIAGNQPIGGGKGTHWYSHPCTARKATPTPADVIVDDPIFGAAPPKGLSPAVAQAPKSNGHQTNADTLNIVRIESGDTDITAPPAA